MKKITIFFCLLLGTFNYAQKGLVTYVFVPALGIGNANAPENQCYLLFNKQISYFVTAKERLEKGDDRLSQKSFSNEDEGSIYNGVKMSEEGDQVVNHLLKKTMWSNLMYRKQVYLKEVTPEIKWKILKETKKIGKFTCQKAIANFRGRNYTAWFTPDIPVPYGPWKLQGLPGLILEAYDTNKYVYWYTKSIEYPSHSQEEPTYLKIPKNKSFLDYNEFKKFQKSEIVVLEEKTKMMKKSFPDITFSDDYNLCKMFIECE